MNVQQDKLIDVQQDKLIDVQQDKLIDAYKKKILKNIIWQHQEKNLQIH